MSDESLLKSGLIVTVVGAMVTYHALSALDSDGRIDLMTLWTIGKWAVLTVFIAFAITTDYIPRWLPGSDFIGGKYEGQSSDFKVETDDEPSSKKEPQKTESPHDEYFSIKQTLFATTIKGTSIVDGQDHSAWNGKRYHTDGHIHYFGMRIESRHGTDYGVLQLTVKENGKVFGFYLSGDPKSTKRCNLAACRVQCFRERTRSATHVT